MAAEICVDEHALHRKMMKRILPFLFICYVVSYLDRVNVGFAALTMNQDIGLSATAFGIGAGLLLTGRAAAGGIALVVSIGNLDGFVGPYMIGFVRDLSGGFTAPLLAVGCALLFGAILMVVFGRLVRRDAVASLLPA